MGEMSVEREFMDYDVVIVGAGPCRVSRCMSSKTSQCRIFSVCVVEKGSEVGAHILSGAVLEPSSS